jgi:hypothetical protein
MEANKTIQFSTNVLDIEEDIDLGLPYLEDVILSYECVHHVHFVCSMLVVNCNIVRVKQHCQMWYCKSQAGLGLKLCMFIT